MSDATRDQGPGTQSASARPGADSGEHERETLGRTEPRYWNALAWVDSFAEEGDTGDSQHDGSESPGSST